MSTPVRGPVHVVMNHGFKNPASMRLRDVAEWYKKIVSAFDTLGTPTALELKEISQGYDYVLGVVATNQGVPRGWLAVAIQELVRSELSMGVSIESDEEA